MEEVSVGRHVIRMAEIKDIPFIMDFLDKHWEAGCLLSRDRAYFEYEYVVDGRLNFLVASHKDTGSIDATMGIIQCSKKSPYDGFSVMWVCNPGSGTKFLGMAVYDYQTSMSGIRVLQGVGLTPHVGAKIVNDLYSVQVNKLNHYYRLANRSEFKIAEITRLRRTNCDPSHKKLTPVPSMRHLNAWFDLNSLPDAPMYKDAWYIEHRYYNHPYYKFNIWGIAESPGKLTGLLIGRVVRCNGSKALRIMDFLGPDNALDGIGNELDFIMDANDIEYTDFYCAGISHENMRKAGFVLRDDQDKNIIPNHFEPYEKNNVDIFYTGVGVRICKGDGDQGRPKRLRLPFEWAR